MAAQLRVFPLNIDFIYVFLPFTPFTNVGKLTKEILFSCIRRLIFLLLERPVKAVKAKKTKKFFILLDVSLLSASKPLPQVYRLPPTK